jgi:hypothetical protein
MVTSITFINRNHFISLLFFLASMYSRKNKSGSNKSTIASSSNSVNDRALNLDDDYEETLNIEVTNQGLTTEDNKADIYS